MATTDAIPAIATAATPVSLFPDAQPSGLDLSPDIRQLRGHGGHGSCRAVHGNLAIAFVHPRIESFQIKASQFELRPSGVAGLCQPGPGRAWQWRACRALPLQRPIA